MKQRLGIAATGVVGLGILLALSVNPAAAQDKIKIGVIVTLSGPAAALGQQVRDGFALGVKDLVIVDTPDALLIADRARAQEVSGIVARLKKAGRKEQARHLRSYRPWGYFETLSLGPRFQVKLLHVKPGGMLSMQMHHHRSEHWVVVHGTAKVSIGGEDKLVRENESVYIVATQWHRLENPGKTPLEIIEVQIGSYLGEDDIVRGDDVYKRSPEETK